MVRNVSNGNQAAVHGMPAARMLHQIVFGVPHPLQLRVLTKIMIGADRTKQDAKLFIIKFHHSA